MQLYQIGFSGFYKDLEDPKNLLKWLGSEVTDEGWFIPNWKAIAFGYGVKLSNMTVAALLLITIPGQTIWNLMLISVWFAVILHYIMLQASHQKIEKKPMLRNCTMVEIASFYIFITATEPLLGWQAFLFFAIYPVAWFILFNRIQWGKGWIFQPHV